MLNLEFSYETCVRNSEQVSWKVDEVMPPGTRLDFSKPFLPEALSGSQQLAFLDPSARVTLNQIMGNAYINLFMFVEEYIFAQILRHAEAELFGDHTALRALTRFADEELKHQDLFRRYKEAFDRDFPSACGVLGAAKQVASVILSKHPIAVMITTLHLEIMTQAHYVQCVKNNVDLDPFFARLLHYHWLEEAQHAKIDALELDKLLDASNDQGIQTAFDDYIGLIDAFDGLLQQQAQLDHESLVKAVGNGSNDHVDDLIKQQHSAYRKTFLTQGMTNKSFTSYMERILPSAAKRIADKAASLT